MSWKVLFLPLQPPRGGQQNEEHASTKEPRVCFGLQHRWSIHTHREVVCGKPVPRPMNPFLCSSLMPLFNPTPSSIQFFPFFFLCAILIEHHENGFFPFLSGSLVLRYNYHRGVWGMESMRQCCFLSFQMSFPTYALTVAHMLKLKPKAHECFSHLVPPGTAGFCCSFSSGFFCVRTIICGIFAPPHTP